MSSLTEARQSIINELADARQGQAFYQPQVARLEAVLAALEQVQQIDRNRQAATTPLRTRGSKGKAKTTAVPAETKAAANSAALNKTNARDTTLPSTGKDFWPNLIKEQPHAGPGVLAAAIKSFGFEPNSNQRKKLVSRMTAAHNTMVSTGVIQDSGHGRGRRFFKANGMAAKTAA